MDFKEKIRGRKGLSATAIILVVTLIVFVITRDNTTMQEPVSGEWAKILKAPPEELTKYASEHPLRLKNAVLKRESLSRSHLVGLRFENVVWDDGFAQDGSIVNSEFIGGKLLDVSFAGSKLENVVFDGVEMHVVEFVGAELINVTFRNCKIYNSEIRNLINSKVLVENSEIFDTNFFDSQVAMTFRNVKVERKAYMTDLAEGSTVLIEDSHIGPYSDFSRSRLLSFVIRNTTIDNSRANGITAKKVVLDNVVSDFAIADSTVGSVEIRSLSGRFSLGGTKAVSAVIEDCSAQKIYLDEFVADRLSLRNCNIEKFVLDAAIVKDATLANLTVGELVLDSLKAGKLVLNNVLVNHKLSAQGAMAEDIPAPNWRSAAGAAIEAEGSNIPMPQASSTP